MKKYLLLLLSLLLLTACSSKTTNDTSNAETTKPQIYTSFYAIYDFADKIGGDKIDLYNVVPAGTEPHDWEPSAHDMLNLESADVLFYNGLGMESWIDKVKGSITNENITYVELSQYVDTLEGDHVDPHIWLDPSNVKLEAEAIKDTLIAVDSQNADYYTKNYNTFINNLDELNTAYKDTLSQLPNKDIVVSHEAYSYMCSAYDLNQIAIDGMAADSEPSPTKMSEIISIIKDNNIKVVFFEELLSPKVAQTIADETGAQMLELNPFEGLSEEDIQAGKDYLSVMRENLDNLVVALS